MKSGLLKLILFSGMVGLSGCSSVMSHTGGKEGSYPGTRASAQMLGNSDANWGTKSLVALDMPFAAAAVGYVPYRQLDKITRREKREGLAGDQRRDSTSGNASALI